MTREEEVEYRIEHLLNFSLRFVPVLCLAGPLFILDNLNGFTRPWSKLGAVMTGVGCLIMYLKIQRQSKQIEELARRLEMV